MSYHLIPLQQVPLSSCRFLLSAGRVQWNLPEALPLGQVSSTPTTYVCRRGVSALWSSSWPSSGLAPTCPCLFHTGEPRSKHVTLGGVSPDIPPRVMGREEGQNDLPWSAGCAALDVSAHCWLISSLSSTRIPKSFTAGLLSTCSSSCCY